MWPFNEAPADSGSGHFTGIFYGCFDVCILKGIGISKVVICSSNSQLKFAWCSLFELLSLIKKDV